MNLTRKVGPLPVWAWGAILGLVGYYVYSRYKSSSTTSASGSTAGVLDPNAVDPNTGFTYGEEESAALNANTAAGQAAFANASGQTWVYYGPTGKSQLPNLSYYISKSGA